ncbi:hypothetical protein [Alistipes sp. AF48-12]|uniref:hypothetical protein n=1 Tax=Alistipes sp. AF48-12 TaxID=2291998 RepID=UPI0021753339|nr:hypothetical protein [Alistipes sp. AF48-12]
MTNLKNILFTACAALLTQGCHMTADRGISTDGARHFFADRQIDRRVDSVMRLMTLDEKIGQLVLYSSHFTTTGPTLPKNVEEAIRNGTCAIFSTRTFPNTTGNCNGLPSRKRGCTFRCCSATT